HHRRNRHPTRRRRSRVEPRRRQHPRAIVDFGGGSRDAEKLRTIVGESGDVRLYEPLSKHTTLRVGGPAQFWVEPQSENAFAALIRFCRDENLPLFVMGRGSNLLVRDGGIRGVVIHPCGGDFDKIEINGSEITAGAGVKLREVAYAARAAN